MEARLTESLTNFGTQTFIWGARKEQSARVPASLGSRASAPGAPGVRVNARPLRRLLDPEAVLPPAGGHPPPRDWTPGRLTDRNRGSGSRPACWRPGDLATFRPGNGQSLLPVRHPSPSIRLSPRPPSAAGAAGSTLLLGCACRSSSVLALLTLDRSASEMRYERTPYRCTLTPYLPESRPSSAETRRPPRAATTPPVPTRSSSTSPASR